MAKTPEEKYEHILEVLGAWAAVTDVQGIGDFRDEIGRRSATTGLTLTVKPPAAETLSLTPREDADGAFEEGYMPLIWIEAGVRTAFGEIKVDDLVFQLDKAIGEKNKRAN